VYSITRRPARQTGARHFTNLSIDVTAYISVSLVFTRLSMRPHYALHSVCSSVRLNLSVLCLPSAKPKTKGESLTWHDKWNSRTRTLNLIPCRPTSGTERDCTRSRLWHDTNYKTRRNKTFGDSRRRLLSSRPVASGTVKSKIT